MKEEGRRMFRPVDTGSQLKTGDMKEVGGIKKNSEDKFMVGYRHPI
jgi:hypothetical protein